MEKIYPHKSDEETRKIVVDVFVNEREGFFCSPEMELEIEEATTKLIKEYIGKNKK